MERDQLASEIATFLSAIGAPEFATADLESAASGLATSLGVLQQQRLTQPADESLITLLLSLCEPESVEAIIARVGALVDAEVKRNVRRHVEKIFIWIADIIFGHRFTPDDGIVNLSHSEVNCLIAALRLRAGHTTPQRQDQTLMQRVAEYLTRVRSLLCAEEEYAMRVRQDVLALLAPLRCFATCKPVQPSLAVPPDQDKYGSSYAIQELMREHLPAPLREIVVARIHDAVVRLRALQILADITSSRHDALALHTVVSALHGSVAVDSLNWETMLEVVRLRRGLPAAFAEVLESGVTAFLREWWNVYRLSSEWITTVRDTPEVASQVMYALMNDQVLLVIKDPLAALAHGLLELTLDVHIDCGLPPKAAAQGHATLLILRAFLSFDVTCIQVCTRLRERAGAVGLLLALCAHSNVPGSDYLVRCVFDDHVPT